MEDISNLAQMDPFYSSPSPGAIAVPILAILTLVLDLPCFAWHIKNRNLPAACLVFWIILGNLFNFINALVWPTDNIDTWYQGQGYCDVEVKLDLAATVGITGALACVMRSLAQALDTQKSITMASKAQRQRKQALDILLCFGLPIYLMLIHYVVQPNRYYIFAIAGCTPSFDNSWPSIVLVYVWPTIFCLLDAYYCTLLIIRLHRYRRDFAAILRSSSSGLSKSRFLRLFFVSLILLVIYLPVQSYVFYRNASVSLITYDWGAIHDPEAWNSVISVPTFGVVPFDRWIRISLGFTVFFCFGLGAEAKVMYRTWALGLGLGHVFPALKRTPGTKPSKFGNSSKTSGSGSFGSKARLVLKNKLRRPSGSSWFSQSTPSPSYPERTFPRLTSVSETVASCPPTVNSTGNDEDAIPRTEISTLKPAPEDSSSTRSSLLKKQSPISSFTAWLTAFFKRILPDAITVTVIKKQLRLPTHTSPSRSFTAMLVHPFADENPFAHPVTRSEPPVTPLPPLATPSRVMECRPCARACPLCQGCLQAGRAERKG